MIKNFACKETAKVFNGAHTRKFPALIVERAQEQLFLIAAATSLQDLCVPPGNHLEALKGVRKGPHSIRVNQAWRLCFEWHDGNAYAVALNNHYS